MTGLGFWVVAAGLAVAVAAVLGTALRRKLDAGAAPDADMVVYKDQLAEIARDLLRGTLAEAEAARLRTEIGKRILEADRSRSAGAGKGQSGSGLLAMGLIATLTVPGAMAAYWWLGAPGYPDMALGPRLADLDAGIAARPSQEAALAKADRVRDPVLDATLATELAAISDPVVLRKSFQTRFEAGEMQAALRTAERLHAVLGAKAEANDHAILALTLVAEAGGYVSPEAEAQLREALSGDMGNEMARYLVGEMFLQGGRYDQAFRFWRPIAEGGSAAPWVGYIREEIEAVAGLAGIPYALPDAVGPSSADVAAAGEMTAEDRQAMIEGMVAQLSDRLATEGGPVEDWNRLIRSLVVLERAPEAQAIYDDAKATFAGMAPELSFLRLAAVETGLAP